MDGRHDGRECQRGLTEYIEARGTERVLKKHEISTEGCSRKRAPDGATAGTAVVGASVGERVTAQTNAQRWMARQKADVSTRRVPLQSSK